MKQQIEILAIGAHADDVEIGMGGTIAKWIHRGKQVVICDLTEAELSSNGTPNLRKEEAQHAAKILGVGKRINLRFPDRGITGSHEQIKAVARVIRQYRPRVIFAPYHIDRHPDHGHTSHLVREAVFSSGIHRFQTGEEDQAHKATLNYYMINGIHTPHFVVDISNEMDQKMDSLLAYKSQFRPDDGVTTPLTDGYTDAVMARDRLFGKEVGVQFAEGFMTTKPVVIDHDLLGGK